MTTNPRCAARRSSQGPLHPETDPYARIDAFVARSREAVFVRRADRMLMIRPDKTLQLNDSAVSILSALYARNTRGAQIDLQVLALCLGIRLDRLLDDTLSLVDAMGAVLSGDFSPRAGLRFGAFEPGLVGYPTLAEIALTYGCQNRCAFCYASSPHREDEKRPMTTAEVKLVMRRIFHEAHVPSLSFTGGEATLRPDLPDLIAYGVELGLRVNLITNGLRAADPAYAASLVDAGLASAQISLEAGSAALHDEIVGRPGAHGATSRGVRNFRERGIHVHTNTTLCVGNLDVADDLIRYVRRDLGLRLLSMNMVIPTGEALSGPRIGVTYSEVAERLPALLTTAQEEGVELVWYSPIPYCIFNPVLHGLGAKSCACVHGILSVDPSGEVLPCSSFGNGIGSLLEQPFRPIWESRAARYWRDKRFVPTPCRGCPDEDVCAGACPLYWDAAAGFQELPVRGASSRRLRARWEQERRRSRSFGVAPQEPNGRGE